MEESLKDHMNCCRCCSSLLKTTQKTVRISKPIEKRFFALSGIKLIMSENYSNVICESCNSKLSEFSDFREEICEYQTKLYAFVNEHSKLDNEEANELIDEENIEEESLTNMKVETLVQEEPIITFIPQNPYEEQFMVSNVQEEDVKPLKFCEICNQYIPHKSFYQHKYRHHAASFQFTCDYDGKMFKQKSEIREHMKTHSNPESRERFLCGFCHNSFLSISALRHHENFFHSDYIEEHPCDECGKIYASRMKLMQHKNTCHTNGSTFMCGECNKFYANPASLKKHVDKTHGNKIPCHLCGKLFAQLSIRQHMKVHSEPQFVCSFENCSKKFRIQSALKVHLKMHQKPTPVQCPDCDATFPTSKHLSRHQKRQHSSFRAKCEVADCTHSTTRKDYLVRHYNSHRELDTETRNELIARVKDIKEIGW